MLNVLITAAGVTTVWHMVNVANKYFNKDIRIHLCDTNDKSLVPAATICDNFYRVPGFSELGYYEHMLNLIEKHNIDVIVPLIDQDLFIWARDNPDLNKNGIVSTGPLRESAELLSNKKSLNDFLTLHDLPTPQIVERDKINSNEYYILKKKIGCGSQGIKCVKGSCVGDVDKDEIIQERCNGSECEITAEIYNAPGKLKVFCRKRLATKAGVCTKAEPVIIPEITDYIKRFVSYIDCPTAFCAQFLIHNGKWCMIDCNLRIGAGTAMSSAAGFQLVRAFWASICGIDVQEEWLTVKPEVKKILRVYKEITVE